MIKACTREFPVADCAHSALLVVASARVVNRVVEPQRELDVGRVLGKVGDLVELRGEIGSEKVAIPLRVEKREQSEAPHNAD